MNKKITLLLLLPLLCFFTANAQSPQTILCKTTVGGAGQITSTGTFTDPLTGNINISTTSEGYATFDLSSIPANATILKASIVTYAARTGGTGTNTTVISGSNTDFATLSGTALYSAISAATTVSTTAWQTTTTPSSKTIDLNAAGLALVKANLSGTISLGFYLTGTATRTYTIAGETSANPPQLIVTYYVWSNAYKYAAIPYTQNFESWVNLSSTSDVPDSNWTNFPPLGNNSWRRNDQGATASWSNSYSDQYIAPQGNYYARFNIYAPTDSIGTLDLHLNCSSSTNTKLLSFYYINKETDSLNVFLSVDGGANFTRMAGYSTATTWTQYVLPITSNAPNVVVRFAAKSNFGSYDKGLDNVSVTLLSNCSGAPAATTASPAKATLVACNPSQKFRLSTVYTDGGITYQWRQSTDGVNFSPITNATDSTYTGSFASGTTYVNCVVKCTASGQTITSTTDTVIVGTQPYAALPYVQNFDNTWVNGCGTDQDAPDLYWVNGLPTVIPTNSTGWRRSDYASWGKTTEYQPCPTGSYCAMFKTSSTQAANGPASINLDLYVNCSTSPGTQRLTYYYNNTPASTTSNKDSLTVSISTNGPGGPFTQVAQMNGVAGWTMDTVDFLSSSATTIVRFTGNAYFGYNNSDVAIDAVNIVTLTACSGAPTPATTSPVKVNLTPCTPNPTFTVTGNYGGVSGLTYQWESSTNGVSFTPIPSATNTTYTGSSFANGTTYLRCVVKCTGSGQTTNSNVDTIIMTAQAYAAMPYTQDFESWVNGCGTSDAPDLNWTGTPVTGNNAWRRDDQGSTASWSNQNGTSYTAQQGSHWARFNIWAAKYSVGILDLHLNCSASTNAKQLNFYYQNADSGIDSLDVLLSVDSGANFTTIGHYLQNTGWAQKSITFTSASPKTIIRFAATSNYNSQDIGIDNLSVVTLSTCSGTPAAAVTAPVKSNLSACNSTQTLTLTTNYGGASGITYQWQQSTDGINFSPISSATNTAYTGTFNTGTTYIRCVVTCTGSSQSTTSNVDTIIVSAQQYATLPYVQNFDNTWVNGCGTDQDVPDLYWVNGLPTVIPTNSTGWRRSDYTSWNKTTEYQPCPTGSYCAMFRTSSTQAANGPASINMDLFVNCSTSPGTQRLTYYYNNTPASTTSNKDSLTVSISTNGAAGPFTQVAQMNGVAGWTLDTVDFTSSSATTVVRFTGNAYFGSNNSDVAIDAVNIVTLTACSGAPTAATASPAKATLTACSPNPTFTVTGNYGGISGLTFQWESSTNGVSFTPIPSATNTTYTGSFANGTTYLRCVVKCTGSGQTTNSNVDTVIMAPQVYTTLPYTQDFENWINGCGVSDAPDIYWTGNPITGNNAWRRDDQGSTAGWTNQYTPTYSAQQGSHWARFNIWAPRYSVGTMDLYLNCSANTNTRLLTFYYQNGDTGLDSLDVLLSVDSGANFTRIGHYLANTPSWTQNSITFTSTSPKTIIRFAASSNYGNKDIGIDNLNVTSLSTCSGAPAAAVTTPAKVTLSPCLTTQTFTLTTNYTGIGGITYQWQQSSNGVNFTPITNATNTTYTGTFATGTTYINCVVTCAGSGQSTTSNTDTVIVGTQPYAHLPYIQDFDNVWNSHCGTDNESPDSNWVNAVPTVIPTGSTGWRRSDYTSWNKVTEYQPCPTGNYCAMFRTNGTQASNGPASINLDLYLDCSSSHGSELMTYFYNNDNGTNAANNKDSLNILVSTNGPAGPFTLLKVQHGVTGGWLPDTLAFSSTSAQTLIRFTGNAYFSFNNSDIAIDAVRIFECGSGVTGLIESGALTFCAGDSVTLTADTATVNNTYQWMKDGTPISGATAASYTTLQAGMYKVAVNNARCPDTSVTDTVVVIPAPVPVVTETAGKDLTTGTYNSYQWYLNGQPATGTGATSQTYTPASNGIYYVIVDSNGCKGKSADFTMTDYGVGIISVQDDQLHSVKLYPDPNHGTFTVSGTLNAIGKKKVTFEVMDVVGKVIYSSDEMINGGAWEKHISIANAIANGTYMMHVTMDRQSQVIRFVVNR